jgi:hypothetical protein
MSARQQFLALLVVVVIVLTSVGLSPDAQAGSEAANAPRFAAEDAAAFSKQIEQELAARGARVAIVFRSGRAREDLPDGVRYTHGAFWVHSAVATQDGRNLSGYSVHNLYHGTADPTRSSLVQDWPLNFTFGDAIGEVGIIIPTPEMQRRILQMMVFGAYEDLHNPDYALLSNPHDMRFQNCNEFIIDVIASAVWQTDDRRQIKANLDAWYEPTHLRLGLFERLFGPSADPRLRMSDHDGAIRTATFGSMRDFMTRFELASYVFELEAVFLQPASEGNAGS